MLYDNFQDFWVAWFESDLGMLVNQNHGGRFYKDTFCAGYGTTFRTNPIGGKKYCTLELPGKSCQLLGFQKLSQIYNQLSFVFGGVVTTRLDTAFDGVPFSVTDFYQEVSAGNCRSLFKRENIKYFESPYETRENNIVGTHGLTIGGRSSTRFLRVYDKHGETRLEIEYKKEKAVQVADDIFTAGMDSFRVAMGHLRDYIDIFSDWWSLFISGVERLYKKLDITVKTAELAKITNWLVKQVCPALSIALDAHGQEFLDAIVSFGRQRRVENPRYRILLSLA